LAYFVRSVYPDRQSFGLLRASLTDGRLVGSRVRETSEDYVRDN